MSKSKVTNFSLSIEFSQFLTQVSDETGRPQAQLVRWLLPKALVDFRAEFAADPGAAVTRGRINEMEAQLSMVKQLAGLPDRAVAPTAPASPSQPKSVMGNDPWPEAVPIKRGPTVWFPLDGICKAYGVPRETLLNQIALDDQLEYAGKLWIDNVGLTQLRELCPDSALATRVNAWVVQKQATAN